MPLPPPIIIPSLLAANWSKVASEVQRAEEAGARWLHLDIMDGHFVDNISFGPQMVKVVRKCTGMFLDVHLMIHRADHYLERFIEAGADNITIHVEADYDTGVVDTLKRIKAAGIMCGIALHPDTPFDLATPYLADVNILLVMTVVPGFGGQAFMEKQTMPKVSAASEFREAHKLKYNIEVDGGIYPHTAPIARKHGADLFVCGTSCFGPADMGGAMAELLASVSGQAHVPS